MFLHLFPHRDTESLSEGRLIFRQNPEAPRERPQTVLERLTDEHANEADLEQAVVELPEESDVYRAVVLEGQKLDQKQRGIVGANLKRLSERIEVKAKTQTDQVEVLAKVERMRSALSAPSEARPVTPVPAPESVPPLEASEGVSTGSSPVEAEKSLWTRGWEQAGKYWDQTPPTVKKLGAVAVVAAFTYGAVRFVQWLWGGTKEVAEKTVEKTKEGMGWFAKTMIAGSLLAVAGVAGYIGMGKFKDYLSSVAGDIKDAVKEHAVAAKDELKKAAAETRDEIAEHGSAAVDRVRGAAQAGVEKIDEKKQERAERRAEAGPDAAPKAKIEEAAKKADEYAPGVAVFLLSKYLKSDKVADVFESLKGQKLGDLLATYDPIKQEADPAKLKAFSVVPAGAEGAEAKQYEQAAQKLVAFCGKRGPEARALYERSRKPTDVPFEEITLEQYVLSLGGGLSLAADAVEFSHDLSGWKPDVALLKRMKEGSLSVGRKIRDLKDQRLSRLSSPLQDIEMKEVVQYLLEADGGVFAQRSVRSVLSGAAQYRLTEEQIGALPETEQKKARIHALVVEICERALPTGHELAPFFHRTFPDRAWGNDKAANEAVIDQYMQEMSVAQALRFFSYWQMIRSQSGEEQVGGLVALQYEVLQFIERRDPGYFGGFIKPKFKSAVVGLTEDLASPTFGQAIAEVAKVDAAIMDRVCDMLKEPAQRLAYYAGLAALGPVKYLAEWGLGAWEKHPVSAPLVAGTAAYGLLSPVRAAVNAPFRFGWWWHTRKDPSIAAGVLKSPWQRFNPLRRTYGLLSEGAHYMARKEAGSWLSQISEAIDRLPDEVSKTRARAALERCLRSGAKDVHLRELSATVDDISRGKPAVAFAELKRHTRLFAFSPGAEKARSALGLYARPFREQLVNLRVVREMRAAGLAGSMLWGAGLAAQGYAAYEDWREVGERTKEKKDVVTQGVNVLAEVRQKLEQDGRYQMAPDGRSFVHKASGVVVDLKMAERQLTNVEGAFDSRINAQVGRAVNSTAAFAGLALLGPRLAMGPAGLVVVGVELVIRGGIAAWEQSKMRKFIEDSPPWILAALGMQATTGTSEEDWLNNASSWMISDALWFGQNDGNKEKIRDRVLFTVFCQDLRQAAPEVLGEIFDGVDTPDRLDDFFAHDFRSVVLPYFSIALFARGEEGTRWSNARSVDTDSGWLVVPPRTTMVDVRRAMREAAAFTLQHMREQRYLRLMACRQRFAEQGLGEQWEQAMTQVGGMTVFGQSLRESPLKGTEQKSRAQLLLDVLLRRLEQAPGDTRADKLRATQNLLEVTPAEVAGLSSVFNLLSSDQLLGSIDDPATRMKLQDVRAQTLGEEEAHKHQRWNDWSVSRLTHMPTAVDQMDAIFYSAPFGAANLIAESLGEPPIHKNTSVLDLLGRSQDAASYDTARSYITEGLDRLCARRAAKDGPLRRSPSYDELYGENGPVVFTRGNNHPNRALARFIRYPGVEAQGYETNRLQAVFLEGQDIGGNHSGVLATYIFGDLESGKISILQRGAGTFMLSQMPKPGFIDGLDRALTLQEFLARPGAEELLQGAKKALAERKAKAAGEEQQRTQLAEQAQRTAVDTWQTEAPKRAETIAAQKQLRAAALARIQSHMVAYVPGEYEVDDQHHQMRLAPGLFHGRFGDADVEISDIQTASAMSSSAPEIDPTPFRFQVLQGGKRQNFTVTMDALRAEPSSDFTREDQQLTREVLVTPMNLAGHPRAGDPAFVGHVRREELNRVLRMARYRGGNGWTGREYLTHLQQELWPLYRDTESKSVFLNMLLNNLLDEPVITGGVFSSPYNRILAKMKHKQ
ncbi:MAG: hypothetical protein Q7S29_00555 [Candidatus Peribacter sp.]|nr:hypothetical protein [Candidatus Peribacter sp.]